MVLLDSLSPTHVRGDIGHAGGPSYKVLCRLGPGALGSESSRSGGIFVLLQGAFLKYIDSAKHSILYDIGHYLGRMKTTGAVNGGSGNKWSGRRRCPKKKEKKCTTHIPRVGECTYYLR